MKLAFTLTMPNRGSWNGVWSGEGNLYAKVITFSNSKAGQETVKKILDNQPYYYRWDDGWGAAIEVKEVVGQESARIKRKSKGFCGYDWMIDNIRSHQSTYDEKPWNGEGIF